MFLGLLLVGVGLRYVIAPPPLPGSRLVQLVVGGVLVALALALGGTAQGLFRRSGQHPAPWKPSPSLVLQGPYRFTRNPMYVGMTGVQVGIGVMLGNLWVVLLAAPALMIVHYTAVLREEAYLEEKFGDDYLQLKRRVRRYL
ncbi:MAG TPA: isoprenylcysteine carboxylmethyltransferase family protein [Polyangia bacterium]